MYILLVKCGIIKTPNMLFKVDTMVKPTEVQPVVTRTLKGELKGNQNATCAGHGHEK